MKILSYCASLALFIVFNSSCSTNYRTLADHRSLSASEDQCEILAKKRLDPGTKGHRAGRKRTIAVHRYPKPTVFAVEENHHEELLNFPDHLLPESLTASIDISSTVSSPLALSSGVLASNPATENSVADAEIPPSASKDIGQPSSPQSTEEIIAPPTDWSWTIVPAMMGVSSLISMGLLFGAKTKSMQVSAWAAVHPVLSRTIIAACHTVGSALFFYFGNALNDDGINIPVIVPYISMGILALSIAAYPARKAPLEFLTRNYLRRKMYDIALVAAGAMVMMHLGNHHFVTTEIPADHAAIVIQLPALTPSGNPISLVKSESLSKKIVTDQQDPAPVKKRRGTKLLIIFSGIILMAGVAVLSCAMACAGSGAWALVILFGGEAVLIVGMISLYRKVSGTQRRKKKSEVKPTT